MATRRTNKHGRVGVKKRLTRPEQPMTLEEARSAGYRAGHKAGERDGYDRAITDIARNLLHKKLSASNMRKWLEDHLPSSAK